jgi:hypothetical protein
MSKLFYTCPYCQVTTAYRPTEEHHCVKRLETGLKAITYEEMISVADLQVFINATPSTESILQEAQRLTHGERTKDYGHPLDDYTRTAALVSALLAHKLKSPLLPHEAAMIQICVKLSRQINHPKRDNTVDGAGYFWVTQECLDEEQRRGQEYLNQLEPYPKRRQP